jgi:hypothetical protein
MSFTGSQVSRSQGERDISSPGDRDRDPVNDQNPAPRPVPSGSPPGSSYAPTFQPFADKVDTLTEATLIYTFL